VRFFRILRAVPICPSFKRCLASTSTTRYPNREQRDLQETLQQEVCVAEEFAPQCIAVDTQKEQGDGQRHWNKRSALHCVAVCCSAYPSTKKGFADYTATGGLYCNVWQCVAMCCSVLKYIPEYTIDVRQRLGLGLLLVLSYLLLLIMRLDLLHQ